MKYLLLAMMSTSAWAADKEIRLLSITNTPTWRIDVYTRGGQTNLVCDTRMIGDSVHRTWSFFHEEVKVAQLFVNGDSQDFRSQADSPYSVIFRARSPQGPGSVLVTSKDGIVLNIFTCVEGAYNLADRREIEEMANGQREVLKRAREFVK